MNEIFKNTDEALRFAFNFSSQQYAESQMAKLQKRVIGNGKGLVAIDGAMQAGLILSEMKHLDPLKFHCLVARHAARFKECTYCGCDSRTQVWNESIVALRDWAALQISGLSHAKVREAVIMKYYGEKINLKEVSDRVRVPIKTIYDQRSKIIDALKKLDDAAQNEIHDMLSCKDGLVESA